MTDFFAPINNLTKNISRFFKMNPHRHWSFIVGIFFILVGALIIFSFYLLYEIKNEQIFQVTPIEQDNRTLLKEDLLKTTIGVFNNKEAKSSEIKNSPAVYTDPSL